MALVLSDIAAGERAADARSASPFFWTAQGVGLALITFMSFFPALFHLEEYLFFVLLTSAVWVGWREKRALSARSPIDLPLCLLVGWVLLSIPFAIDPWYSFAEWRKLIAQLLVFYWALLVLRANNGDFARAILLSVALGAAVVCVYGLVDFVNQGGTWRERVPQARAPFSDNNWLSAYLVIAIPLLASLVVLLRVWWQRLLSGALTALAFVTQVFAYNRAAWLALVAQVMAFGLYTRRRRLAVGALVACLIIGSGFFLASQIGYQRGTVSTENLDVRLAVWKLGIVSIMEHPVVGVGYGDATFAHLVAGLPMYPESDLILSLHNTFMMVAVGSGIPALFFLLWTLLAIVRISHQQWKTSADQLTQIVTIGVFMVVIGFSVRNVFAYLFAGSLAYLFWIIVAIGLARFSYEREESRSRPGLLR